MSLRVYVAAPYADAAFVRIVHDLLRSLGMVPTSSWAERAAGAEDFSMMTRESLRGEAERNDTDLRDADSVLVIARDGAGGEMFAEARLALEWGKGVVWCGRRTLSAWRGGVELADDLDDGIRLLTEMRGEA